MNNQYGDVSNESFNMAFKEEAEIEKRPNNLKEFNKQIAVEEINRIQRG